VIAVRVQRLQQARDVLGGVAEVVRCHERLAVRQGAELYAADREAKRLADLVHEHAFGIRRARITAARLVAEPLDR
jgi:hypothetical protein